MKKPHTGSVDFCDVEAALAHLGRVTQGHLHNDVMIAERWVRQTERYVRELEEANRMYKLVTDTQKRLLDEKFRT